MSYFTDKEGRVRRIGTYSGVHKSLDTRAKNISAEEFEEHLRERASRMTHHKDNLSEFKNHIKGLSQSQLIELFIDNYDAYRSFPYDDGFKKKLNLIRPLIKIRSTTGFHVRNDESVYADFVKSKDGHSYWVDVESDQ